MFELVPLRECERRIAPRTRNIDGGLRASHQANAISATAGGGLAVASVHKLDEALDALVGKLLANLRSPAPEDDATPPRAGHRRTANELAAAGSTGTAPCRVRRTGTSSVTLSPSQ